MNEMKVSNCLCGGEPRYYEVCYGQRESVLLTGGKPDYFRIACQKCGYSTKEYSDPALAVAEWNKHASQP